MTNPQALEEEKGKEKEKRKIFLSFS